MELNIQTENAEEFVAKLSGKDQKSQKHYLGDPKWVLYQYICDLDSACNDKDPHRGRYADINRIYLIRCGRYAYDKISKFQGFTERYREPGEFHLIDNERGELNLNGEQALVVLVKTLDKKQVVITPCDNSIIGEYLDDGKLRAYMELIYPDDIVLYFA